MKGMQLHMMELTFRKERSIISSKGLPTHTTVAFEHARHLCTPVTGWQSQVPLTSAERVTCTACLLLERQLDGLCVYTWVITYSFIDLN